MEICENLSRKYTENFAGREGAVLINMRAYSSYGEASISAQLRHLRKPQYGAFVVEKRQREAAEVLCGVERRAGLGIPAESRGGARCRFPDGPKDKGSLSAAVVVC